jgi:hypothetical protein
MSILETLSKVTNFLVKREENIRRAFDYLNKYGYISDLQEDNINRVIDSIKRLQRLGGLPETGEIDGKTLTLMSAPRCACPDTEFLTENATNSPRWGLSTLTWYVANWDREISKAEWVASIDEAFYNWSQVCNLKFQQVQSKQEANIVLDTGRGRSADFDGPSGTLAWMSVISSYNFKGQHLGKFDEDETWIPKGKTGRGIYLVNVATHEIGHSLIGSHSRVKTALMAPFYSPTLAKPQPNDDISRAVNLYGKPVTSSPQPIPTPVPTPTASGEDDEIVIRLKGQGARVSIDGYRISRMS